MFTHARRSIGWLAGVCLTLALAPSALAGSAVDPTTLNPIPPDIYTCQADGPNTICRASFEDTVEGGDIGRLCGDQPIFEWTTTSVDVVRYYDANRNLVRRTGRASLSGFFSLSSSGAEPTIDVIAHSNWIETFAVPGDLDSGLETEHGLINHTGGSSAPGFGTELHASGLFLPDGTFYGLNNDFGTPSADEAICAVLQG
jgi:hypothetical protein